MALAAPAPLYLQPRPSAQARLVLLHGWGADADDLMMLGASLAQRIHFPLDVVALPAPEAHPQGIGRQWYGLFPAQWEAVPAAQASLRARLLALAEEGIPLESTVVLGFSQGAAMALSTGCGLPLAGLISCSGYPHPGWEAPITRPPVLLLHGREDEVVPSNAAEALVSLLKASPAGLNLELFSGGHTIPESSFTTMSKALDTWLNKPGVEG